MNTKHLLGLDSCPLSEQQILQKLRDAELQNKHEVIFSLPGNHTVKVSVPNVHPEGIMDGYNSYYREAG